MMLRLLLLTALLLFPHPLVQVASACGLCSHLLHEVVCRHGLHKAKQIKWELVEAIDTLYMD